MHDATAEAEAHGQPELAHPPAPSSAYNPADVVPDLTAFVSGLLGPLAGTTVAAIDKYTPDLLIHLALVKKLELIHATLLSVKAKADHAQQTATSALNVASAAASTWTYAQATAALLKPPLAPPTPKPRASAAPKTPASKPKKTPATSPTPSEPLPQWRPTRRPSAGSLHH